MKLNKNFQNKNHASSIPNTFKMKKREKLSGTELARVCVCVAL